MVFNYFLVNDTLLLRRFFNPYTFNLLFGLLINKCYCIMNIKSLISYLDTLIISMNNIKIFIFSPKRFFNWKRFFLDYWIKKYLVKMLFYLFFTNYIWLLITCYSQFNSHCLIPSGFEWLWRDFSKKKYLGTKIAILKGPRCKNRRQNIK